MAQSTIDVSRVRLRMTSCQAPNSEYIGRALAEYLRDRLDYEITWVDDIPWQARYAGIESGAIDVAWICGAPYVRLRARGVGITPLAAPVWRAPRYGDAPVYFSDVVTRADAHANDLAALRGAHWAYNEPGSYSGYECVRAELARLNMGAGFFGGVTEAGSHQNALRLILEGAVDAAAIDSTVLEEEVRRTPALSQQVRIVHAIGPAPMPPWVASPQVPAGVQTALREALVEMDATPDGRRLLADTPLARLAAVSDSDYDATRTLLQMAETVSFMAAPGVAHAAA